MMNGRMLCVLLCEPKRNMDCWMDPSNNQTAIHQNLKIGGPSIQCLSHECLTPLNPHFHQPYLTWKM